MCIARSRLVGIYLVISSAVLWSTAGLFVRIADMDVWSMVAWRSAFSFVTLGAFILIRRRWTKKGVKGTFGMPGVVACVVSTVAAITYIASLQWTTVANVMTVYATLPFVATGIAFLWLHDRVTYRFVIAGCLAFLGVAISVGAAMSANDLLGILAAFIMTAGCATQIVIAKRFPSMDSTMMTVLAALACFCIALPLMQYSIPTSTQLLACAFYGIFTTGIGYVLLLLGSRRIGSGEAGLLSMLDVILGPIWVWIFYSEEITLPVLLGGAVVLTSVFWYLLPSRKVAAPV
ncbi:drug/metabolite transporter (DMT)-like permease [Rhizobium sp. BK077]|uniref:DMT family transporter n=1 Tax=unclassified Rhizobium TaxID=2613769 RepID=UPI00161C4B26|nr:MULTISPECIES: DMT family transporter [unclassified Rhizobium]MBB3299856.1 drug/metabolite transporter (DMT)-like permease [Rhizobium sp. BK112]MBB3369313.1 drug/metabolite transporter (DMT)-like permease [Rhizobium sp. BK077]MBB4180142.1 drug/metabolite transporter (DMT)-like permease [Rhizobium sp. BK109]